MFRGQREYTLVVMGATLAGLLRKLSAMASLGAATVLASSAALGAPVIDVSGFAEKLVVLSDGKEGYIAVEPFGERERFYYGTDRTLYAQRPTHYSADKTRGREERGFWAPWTRRPGARGSNAAVLEIARDVGYRVRCGDVSIAYREVESEERARILRDATFRPPKWERKPMALARDEKGNYYLVDKHRDPYRKDYRMFFGRRGRMSERRILDVVADSGGYIFATRKGDLSIENHRPRPKVYWARKKTRRELTYVPVERNVRLIYFHLDVYRGEQGTPCDYY